MFNPRIAQGGIRFLFVFVASLLLVSQSFSQTTSFTYQGSLSAGGVPANGNYNFEFRLFDALVSGTQQGLTNTRNNVLVANGVFATVLDFGAIPFPGADRFIEITVTPVSCPSPPCATTVLSPRSQVYSTPYAIRASTVTGPIIASSSTAGLAVSNDSATGAAISAEALNGGPIFKGLSNDPSSPNPKFIVTTIGQVRANGSVFAKSFQSNSGNFAVLESGNMTVGNISAGAIDSGQITTSGNANIGGGLNVTGGVSAQGAALSGLLTANNGANIFNGLSVNGFLTVSGPKNNLVKLADGRSVLLYANESPEYWYEDFGTVTLRNGRAVVVIDRTFADVTNTGIPYKVFLTPNGNTRGLYVVRKTPKIFEVRENRGGHSNVSFDYRIVAKRRGYESERFSAPPSR